MTFQVECLGGPNGEFGSLVGWSLLTKSGSCLNGPALGSAATADAATTFGKGTADNEWSRCHSFHGTAVLPLRAPNRVARSRQTREQVGELRRSTLAELWTTSSLVLIAHTEQDVNLRHAHSPGQRRMLPLAGDISVGGRSADTRPLSGAVALSERSEAHRNASTGK